MWRFRKLVDFRYYLNRQGPRGQQGVKGEQGYSPQVIVGKNTASEFTLKVINEDGSFETENLKAVPEDRGGTYVRYDKDTYQEYIGDPDFASTERYGVVRLATKEDLEAQEESLAVSSAILNTYLQENYLNKVHGDVVTGDVSFRGDTGFLNAPHIDKIKDELHNQYITRNVSNYTTEVGSLTIPDDGSTRLKQGVKEVAYTSDLTEFVTNAVLNSAISNLVTLDTPQTITGNKTFTGKVNIAGGALTVEGLATLNQANAQYLNAVSITSTGEINATSIKANGLRSDDIQTTENKKYLTEVDVDNQTIQIVNGKLHANIDELGNKVNDLSNKVTTLQTSKQDTLTAGANITIVDNVISAIGGGGGVSIDDSTISSASTWSSSKINDTKNNNIFDIGKFDIVGNATITDDGIASGFSRNTNYVSCAIQSLANAQAWVLETPIINLSDLTTNPTSYLLSSKQNTAGKLEFFFRSSGKLSWGVYDENGTLITKQNTIKVFNINSKYQIKLEFTGTRYILSYKEVGVADYVQDSYKDSSTKIGSFNNLYLGSGNGYSLIGSIDLKQFSITVDGKKVFSGLMESTKPIYDKITNTSTELSTLQTETDNNFSAVNSALNEKANLSDLANYVPLTTYNALLARVVALETQIDGGIA